MLNKTSTLICLLAFIFLLIMPTNKIMADSLDIELLDSNSIPLKIETKEELDLFLSSMDRKEDFDFKKDPIAKIKNIPIYADHNNMRILKVIDEEHWNHLIIDNLVENLIDAGKSYSEIAYAMNNRTNYTMELEIKDSILQHLILNDLVKNKTITKKQATNLLENKNKIKELVNEYEASFKKDNKASNEEISKFIKSKKGIHISYSMANYESLESAKLVEANFKEHLNPALISFDKLYTGIVVNPDESRDFNLSYYQDINMNIYRTLKNTNNKSLSKPFSPDGIMHSLIYIREIEKLNEDLHYKEIKEHIEDEKYAAHLDELWNKSEIEFLIPNALKNSDRISMILTTNTVETN